MGVAANQYNTVCGWSNTTVLVEGQLQISHHNDFIFCLLTFTHAWPMQDLCFKLKFYPCQGKNYESLWIKNMSKSTCSEHFLNKVHDNVINSFELMFLLVAEPLCTQICIGKWVLQRVSLVIHVHTSYLQCTLHASYGINGGSCS